MENEPRDVHELAADSRIRLIRAFRQEIIAARPTPSFWAMTAMRERAENCYNAILLTIYPEDGLSLRTNARKERR